VTGYGTCWTRGCEEAADRGWTGGQEGSWGGSVGDVSSGCPLLARRAAGRMSRSPARREGVACAHGLRDHRRDGPVRLPSVRGHAGADLWRPHDGVDRDRRAARGVARGLVVLGAMDDLDFFHPVRAGEIAILRARVEWVGRTSLEVGVRVCSRSQSVRVSGGCVPRQPDVCRAACEQRHWEAPEKRQATHLAARAGAPRGPRDCGAVVKQQEEVRDDVRSFKVGADQA